MSCCPNNFAGGALALLLPSSRVYVAEYEKQLFGDTGAETENVCFLLALCAQCSAGFYSAMHYSLSVCDVGGSCPHRLKILETNCANNYLNIFALRGPKVIHLLPGEHEEIWGEMFVKHLRS